MAAASAAVTVTIDQNDDASATPGFQFKRVPAPVKGDAAASATFTIVDGERDPNGGTLERLHDDKVPTDEDQPAASFFFKAGTDGGRLLVDLGRAIDIKQVNTYSWHPGTRGPQVYQLYGAAGAAESFNTQPKRGIDPEKCGWNLVAKVDTRPRQASGAGQYGVCVSDAEGAIGNYRYLLFEVFRTEADDAFGNTFYGEIDVIDRHAPAAAPIFATGSSSGREVIAAGDGKYQITLDTSETPDLTAWARAELAPMVREWYPKIVKLLPSEGYQAPERFSITFSAEMRGVAATSGTRIRCAAGWFRQNLKGEAVGAVFHEMVHVAQQYGRARRSPEALRPPGWLVEGVTDYIRWFLYEPQSHGADLAWMRRQRDLSRLRYDASYRITANFLDWVTTKYDKDLVPRLNTAMREGKYQEALWKERTGHTAQELGDEWKKDTEAKVAAASSH